MKINLSNVVDLTKKFTVRQLSWDSLVVAPSDNADDAITLAVAERDQAMLDIKAGAIVSFGEDGTVIAEAAPTPTTGTEPEVRAGKAGCAAKLSWKADF